MNEVTDELFMSSISRWCGGRRRTGRPSSEDNEPDIVRRPLEEFALVESSCSALIGARRGVELRRQEGLKLA